MAEQLTSCKNCGTSVPQNTVFCPNCGTHLRDETSIFTNYSNQSFLSPPPPPPPIAYSQAPNVSQPQGYSSTPYPQNQWSPPGDIQPPKQIKRSRLKVVGIVMSLLLIFGTAGYLTWNFAGKGSPNPGGYNASLSNETPTTAPGSSGSSASSPITSENATTIPLNTTVTYADDTITLIDAKQAQHFTDENASGDILRLDVKEQTDLKSPYFGSYGYSTGVHVILPDGNSVQPINVQHNDIPAPSISRTNWLDFQVPVTTPVDQITLRLGTPTEHTIDIPLKENADVSKYQPRTVTLNKLIQYGNLNWTLTTATWRLSAQGVQSDKDMSYVVLSFKVDSPSTSAYLNQTASDAFRLRSDGSTTAASKFNTFPQAISAGETGKTGTVGFLVPQDSTQFTLVMLVYDRGGVTSTVEVTTDFQIP